MVDFNFLIQSFGLLFVVVFFALLVWSVIWKGLALWKAAKNNDKWWFIIILVVNTVGILEILYIYVFGKKKLK